MPRAKNQHNKTCGCVLGHQQQPTMMLFTRLVALFYSLSLTLAFLPAMQNCQYNVAVVNVRLGAASAGDVETFKKPEFIAAVAAKTGMNKKESEEAIKAVFSIIQEQVNQNKKVALPGFGTFTLRERAARNGRNPQTGQPLEIKASVAFSRFARSATNQLFGSTQLSF
jgi:DNA-binding protein HU-beta